MPPHKDGFVSCAHTEGLCQSQSTILFSCAYSSSSGLSSLLGSKRKRKRVLPFKDKDERREIYPDQEICKSFLIGYSKKITRELG